MAKCVIKSYVSGHKNLYLGTILGAVCMAPHYHIVKLNSFWLVTHPTYREHIYIDSYLWPGDNSHFGLHTTSKGKYLGLSVLSAKRPTISCSYLLIVHCLIVHLLFDPGEISSSWIVEVGSNCRAEISLILNACLQSELNHCKPL